MLVIGIIRVRNDATRAQGVDRIVVFGPMFLAIPMAVFGTNHFLFAESVVPLIPSWIPWHLFWAYFVGACLIAGALSLVVRIYAALAAAMFATMLLLFEALISVPKALEAPGDRFAWAVVLRDLAYASGAAAFATAQPPPNGVARGAGLLKAARLSMGFALLFFAVEHFLHPQFRPGVPLKLLTPVWFPARVAVGYLTGLLELIGGSALIVNQRARDAAATLGAFLFLLVLVVYVPIVVERPLAIGSSLNYLMDTLLLSGSALCLAFGLAKSRPPRVGHQVSAREALPPA